MTPSQEAKSGTAAGPVDERALESGAAFQDALADPGPVDVRVLAVAAATAAGVYRPGRDNADDAVRACITMDGITEKIEKLAISDNGSHGSGSTVEYSDGYYDAQGERIGTVTGSAVVLVTQPHMWQFHSSTVELTDGSFTISGLLDIAAMMRSMTQVLQVHGTAGRYAGKAGYLTLTVADTSQRPPFYTTAFAMC
jgi:hypothetical protein